MQETTRSLGKNSGLHLITVKFLKCFGCLTLCVCVCMCVCVCNTLCVYLAVNDIVLDDVIAHIIRLERQLLKEEQHKTFKCCITELALRALSHLTKRLLHN
ncbi:hypothetical protein GOODEAATRI_007254 [Goodea atripinnis]|uniref:Uncharacterized protein n=1 Tax=Goodea atripinnis TaxID=208336 RepID=A0ABV0MZD6_9TELE